MQVDALGFKGKKGRKGGAKGDGKDGGKSKEEAAAARLLTVAEAAEREKHMRYPGAALVSVGFEHVGRSGQGA